jgi:hypothetical protein
MESLIELFGVFLGGIYDSPGNIVVFGLFAARFLTQPLKFVG